MPGQPPITGIDHVLVGVRDLEAARGDWRRLGFTLCPRGRHIGWGTANYCIMFPDDYVELLGIVDPTQFTNNLDKFLERREGLLGIAFSTGDAAVAAAAFHAVGIAAEGPRDLERILELPDGDVRPAFKLVHLPPAATPGLSAFVCQHLTRELVWQRPWLEHRNGARGLLSVTAVVGDPSAKAIPYGEMFGFDRVRVSDGVVEVDTGGAAIRFTTLPFLARRYAGLGALPRYPLPSLAVLRLAVSDPDSTALQLHGLAIPFRRDTKGALVVGPEHASGVILEFAQG